MREKLSHYDFLPDSTRPIAEELEACSFLKEMFRGLVRQAYQDGFDAGMRKKNQEYQDMFKKDQDEEMRKPPRL